MWSCLPPRRQAWNTSILVSRLGGANALLGQQLVGACAPRAGAAGLPCWLENAPRAAVYAPPEPHPPPTFSSPTNLPRPPLRAAGAYLIDNGRTLILWLGQALPPAFYQQAFGLQGPPQDTSGVCGAGWECSVCCPARLAGQLSLLPSPAGLAL